jgi:hypothetical protein
MSSAFVSSIISILYVLIKLMLNYKEKPVPNVKDGVLVFISSMGGFFISDYFSTKPKITDVFMEAPSF